VPLQESAAAAAGGRLYVMGGFDANGNRLSTVYVFNGNAWSAGPPLPLGVDHPAAATLNDHVYLSGGHSDSGDSARLFRLDAASWTELAPMRHARGAHALIPAGGRLYAVGGNIGAGDVAPAEVYDLGSGQWSDLPPLPTPRNHVAGFAQGSNVCAAGGRFPTTAQVDCFNFESMTWSRLPDLPLPTSGAGAAVMDDGTVVVLGGEVAEESSIVDQFARLSSSNAWTAAETMLVPRHGFQLAVFQGRAWACGGGAGMRPVVTCTSVV
jgi:N-acetylneuraminic acid mutarotase